MYKYENLQRKIENSGEIYAPRVHKHRMPFMVLKRVAMRNSLDVAIRTSDISVLSGVKYTLRGLRDVITARKCDKECLSDLWEPAFSSMLAILQMYKVQIIDGDTTASTLHRTLKSIGCDVVKDGLYASTNSKKLSLYTISKAFSIFSFTRKNIMRSAARYLSMINKSFGIFFDISDFTEDSIKEMNKLYHDIVLCANRAGYYHTLRYFIAFAPRFCISDELLDKMKNAISTKDYSKEVLVDLYLELKKSYEEDKLPSQCGVFELFNPFHCGPSCVPDLYTDIFGK